MSRKTRSWRTPRPASSRRSRAVWSWNWLWKTAWRKSLWSLPWLAARSGVLRRAGRGFRSQFEALEDRVVPAPVAGATVLVHGRGGDGDLLRPLADAILGRFGGALHDHTLSPTTGVGGITVTSVPGPSDHLVLLYDWAIPAGQAGAGWAEAAGDTLFSTIVGLNLVDPATGQALTSLHFVGEGAGAAVVSEAVERLAEYAVPVDHVTFLDPDPAADPARLGATAGYDVSVWDNVRFADAYYQTRGTGGVKGQPVPGAYNRHLGSGAGLPAATANDHAFVWHSFYLGTIAGQLPAGPAADPLTAAEVADGLTGFGLTRLAGGAVARQAPEFAPNFFNAAPQNTDLPQPAGVTVAGRSADVITIDLPALGVAGSGYALTGVAVVGEAGQTVQTLTLVPHGVRSDVELTAGAGGPNAGYVLMADRVDPAHPGRFYLAAGTGAVAGDRASAAGFQGELRLTFSDGTATQVVRVFVQPGQTAAGDVAGTPDDVLDIARRQQRLRLLGFGGVAGDPLVVDGIVGVETRHATGLFNAAVGNTAHAPADDLTATGLAVLNSAAPPRWEALGGPLQAGDFEDAAGATGYGTSWLADVVRNGARAARAAGVALPVRVTRMSTLDGASTAAPAGDHTAGLAVDVEIPAAVRAASPGGSPSADEAAFVRLLEAFAAAAPAGTRVDEIVVSNPKVAAELNARAGGPLAVVDAATTEARVRLHAYPSRMQRTGAWVQDHALTPAGYADAAGRPDAAGLAAHGVTAAAVTAGRWEPAWNHLTVYNGDFSAAGAGDLVPGWSYSSGGGGGQVVADGAAADPVLELTPAGDGVRRVHSLVYVPKDAEYLLFDVRHLATDDYDRLAVKLGGTDLTLELPYANPLMVSYLQPEFRTVSRAVPDAMKGTVQTLTFELRDVIKENDPTGLSTSAVGSTLRIDNVRYGERISGLQNPQLDEIHSDCADEAWYVTEVPFLGTNLGQVLNLGGALHAAWTSPDLKNAKNMTEVRAALEAAGFDVATMLTDGQLAVADKPFEFFRSGLVTRPITLNGNPPGVASFLSTLPGMAGVTFGGDVNVTYAGSLTYTWGIDSRGIFVMEGRLLTGEVDAAGTLTATLGGAGSVTASATVTDLTMGLDLVSPHHAGPYAGKIYLEDFFNCDDTWKVVGPTGAASVTVTPTVNTILGPVSTTGTWNWTISPTGASLNASSPGWSQPALLSSVLSLVDKGLDALDDAATQITGALSAVPYAGAGLASNLAGAVTAGLGFAAPTPAAAEAYLASKGFTVLSQVSAPTLIQAALSGSLPNTPLIELKYQHTQNPAATSIAAGGTKSLSVAGSGVGFTLVGSLTADPLATFDTTFGLDTAGGFYVVEGSKVTASATVSGGLQGSAALAGLAQITVTAAASGSATGTFTFDDGDATAGEKVYVTGGALPATSALAGSLALNQLTITGSVPALAELPGFPQVTAKGSAAFNLAAGTGSVTIDQDSLLDSFTGVVVAGMNALGDQAAELAAAAQRLPVIGKDVADGLRASIAQPLQNVGLPAVSVRQYLAAHGFTLHQVVGWEDFLLGRAAGQDAIILQYHPPVFAGPTFTFHADDGFGAGPVRFNLAGNLSVTPTFDFDITFGVNLADGPFVKEGATFGLGLPVTGGLSGNAYIGDLKAVAATGQVTATAGARLTFSDFDATSGERFYLFGADEYSTLDVSAFADDTRAVALSGTFALATTLTLSNPAAKIPVIGEFLPSSFSWGADYTQNLVTGASSFTVRQDAAFQNLVQLFTNTEQFVTQKFFALVDQYNPLPQSVRSMLATELPIIGKSAVELLGAPESVNVLLDPRGYTAGKSAAQINTAGAGNSIDYNLDVFEPANLVALLSGQPANLVSVDIAQTFESPQNRITVLPDTPFFSFLGIINITGGVDVIPQFGFATRVKMGVDTTGFYVDAGGTENTVEVSGGLTVSLTVSGKLVVVPLVEIEGTAGIQLVAGARLTSPRADKKLRLQEVLEPSNITVNVGANLNLGLEARVGIIDLGLYESVGKTWSFPLFNKDVGTFADVTEKLDGFKDDMQRKGKKLAGAAAGMVLFGPFGAVIGYYGPEIVQGVEDAAEWAGDKAEVVGKAAQELADNAGRELGKAREQAQEAGRRFDAEVLQPIGQGLNRLGNTIADAFGWGGWDSQDIPERRTIAARQEGSILIVEWNQDWANEHLGGVAADITVDVIDGQIVIDAPDFVVNELVATKRIWTSKGRKTKEKHEDVTHTNQFRWGAEGITTVVLVGSP
ncbi:MAG TPA: hypothetical protein VD866_17100, partial [Urbifossiella sp.]|nr:hypothetical protein [Urbifossiella sp.]